MPHTVDSNLTYVIAIRHENPSTDPDESGWRFGMFTGYDGADWPDGLELSDRVLANNFVAQYKKSDKAEITEKSKSGEGVGGTKLPTSGYIDFESLGKVTDINGVKYENAEFITMLKSNDILPVFNFQTEPTSSMKDARIKDWKNTPLI